jgi:hypothetical protein
LDGAAQQLARAGFRQHGDEAHARRPRHRTELCVDEFHDLAFELQGVGGRGGRGRILQYREGHRHLALEWIGHANHRHLGHAGVARDALLDLARAQPVTGDIDHVVGAAQDEEIAVRVAHAPVEGRIHRLTGNAGPVGFDEAVVVAPHRLHAARRQRAHDGDNTLLVRAVCSRSRA